ncbi:MAG: hypothetical protein EOO81_07095 [Oxalobacteraceae bacterium]|nr:MAG: hypothetical protein EOO81_07095 [Oxalobacteraceae bacterium]
MFCARALMHAEAFLSVAHAALHGSRFGALLASSLSTWRSAKSQLAVCPAAACSPARCAKVPHAIALWLAVLRRPVPGWVRWQANAQQLAAVAYATAA